VSRTWTRSRKRSYIRPSLQTNRKIIAICSFLDSSRASSTIIHNLILPIYSLIDFCTFRASMLRISFWTSDEVYLAFLGAFSNTSLTSLLYESKSLTTSRKLTLFKESRDSSWRLKGHPWNANHLNIDIEEVHIR